MSWLALPGLTDGQYWMVCVGVVGMVVTGAGMARSLYRRHRSLVRSRRAHPAGGRPPYDWASDRRLRQPGHVRRAS